MTDPYLIWQRERDERIAAQYTQTSYASHEEHFDLTPFYMQQPAPREYAHQFLDDFPHGLLDAKVSRCAPELFKDALRVELRATMIGKKLPPHTVTRTRVFSVDLFDSPWQHFKANHADAWWLRWLVRRHPPTTHPVTRTATLTATWEQFVGFPWQDVVSHLNPYGGRFGPAVRFTSMDTSMILESAS